jgi:hypothetical protein
MMMMVSSSCSLTAKCLNSRVVTILLVSECSAIGIIAGLDIDRSDLIGNRRCPLRGRCSVSTDSAVITAEAASRAIFDERASTAIGTAVLDRVTVAATNTSHSNA